MHYNFILLQLDMCVFIPALHPHLALLFGIAQLPEAQRHQVLRGTLRISGRTSMQTMVPGTAPRELGHRASSTGAKLGIQVLHSLISTRFAAE